MEGNAFFHHITVVLVCVQGALSYRPREGENHKALRDPLLLWRSGGAAGVWPRRCLSSLSCKTGDDEGWSVSPHGRCAGPHGDTALGTTGAVQRGDGEDGGGDSSDGNDGWAGCRQVTDFSPCFSAAGWEDDVPPSRLSRGLVS